MKPILTQDSREPMPTEQLINELQSFGVRLVDPRAGGESRRGGAGPSDHKADDHRRRDRDGAGAHRAGVREPVYRGKARCIGPQPGQPRRRRRSARSDFPLRPRFYDAQTADGIPYSKIATLHGRDVLATTVLQTCIRYQSRTKTCQFCAIGQSLAAGRTIERKTPAQLGRSRESRGRARRRHAHGDDDRHAARRAIAARRSWPRARSAVKAAVDLPIQGAMRAARRRCLVRAHARGRRRRARHASRSRDRERAPPHHARQGAGVGRALFRGLRGRGAGVRARPGLDLYPRRPRRQRAGDPRDLRAAGRARRLSLRRAVRADLRHAAGKPSDAAAGLHARDPAAARAHAARGRHAAPRHQGRLRQMRRLLGAVDLRAGGCAA